MENLIVVDKLMGPKITPYKRKTRVIKKAEDILQKVMRNLKSDLYEYIYALDIFEFVAVREEITPSTDGIHIYYHPYDVIRTYNEDNKALGIQIAHMMLHGLLGHFEELSSFQHTRLAGVTMDAQVERLLTKMGVNKRRWHYHERWQEFMDDTEIQGYSIYYEALKNKRLRKVWLGMEKELRRDDHRMWGRKVVQETFELPAAMSGQQGNGSEGEKGSQDGNQGQSGTGHDWKQQLGYTWGMARKITFGTDNCLSVEMCMSRFCVEGAKGYNVGSGNMVVQVQPAEKGNSYKNVLREFLKEKEQSVEDANTLDAMIYTYGMELYGDVPLIEPSEVNEIMQLNNLFIAIDTSGSCSGETACQFVREICNILQEVKDSIRFETIQIIQCDDVIQKIQEYSDVEELSDAEEEMKELRGYGGTSFRPVFEEIDKRMQQEDLEVDALIYLTDSYGAFPDSRPDYPVFFIMPSNCFNENQQPRNSDIPDWITCMDLENE